MKIRILGSGASLGSPLAYGINGNIDINNSHNFRTRTSVLLYIDNNGCIKFRRSNREFCVWNELCSTTHIRI